MAYLTARTLLISVGGTQYEGQVFNAEIRAAAADTDDVTFADAFTGGGRAYTLALTLTQDLATSSLWNTIWASAGTDVTVLWKPYGNITATVTQPHYSMSANVREPDGVFIGGDADASTTKRLKIDVEWPLAAKPTKVTS